MKNLLFLIFILGVFGGTCLSALSVEVPFNSEASMSLDFEGGSWSKSGKIDGLYRMGTRLNIMGQEMSEKAQYITHVYLTRNSEALFLGFDCLDPYIEELELPDTERPESWPKGDKIEVYIDGNRKDEGEYYQFVGSPNGNAVEAYKRQQVQKGDWEVEAKVGDAGWRIVFRIPYRYLGITQNSSGVYGLFFRDSPAGKNKIKERGTWGGGNLHLPSEFGKMIFTND